MNVAERAQAFIERTGLILIVGFIIALCSIYKLDPSFAFWLMKTIGVVIWAFIHSETAIPSLALHFRCTLETAAHIAVWFSSASLLVMVALTGKLPREKILAKLPHWLRFEQTGLAAAAALYVWVFLIVFFPFGGTCASVALVFCFCGNRLFGFGLTFFSNALKNLAWGKVFGHWSVRTQVAVCLILLMSPIILGLWHKRRANAGAYSS